MFVMYIYLFIYIRYIHEWRKRISDQMKIMMMKWNDERFLLLIIISIFLLSYTSFHHITYTPAFLRSSLFCLGNDYYFYIKIILIMMVLMLKYDMKHTHIYLHAWTVFFLCKKTMMMIFVYILFIFIYRHYNYYDMFVYIHQHKYIIIMIVRWFVKVLSSN